RTDDPNFSGNHRKNMMRSVEASLERLDTDYIDLLWVHAWDALTPVEEVMRGLNDLVSSGMVHYIGISDTPAWIVSRANTIADFRGWSPFVGLQVEYSLLQRTPERDLIPMAKDMGLALTPWSPLAGGALTGKYLNNEEGRVQPESARRSERANTIARKVVEVAGKMGCTPAQVALRWAMQQEITSIPIIGGRKLSQIEDNLKTIDIEIPAELMAELNEVSAIEMGFPHDFLQQENVVQILYGGTRDKIKP
ncbi:MAG: aldo/keto reductase, partial [Salibacteraceae bacterium]